MYWNIKRNHCLTKLFPIVMLCLLIDGFMMHLHAQTMTGPGDSVKSTDSEVIQFEGKIAKPRLQDVTIALNDGVAERITNPQHFDIDGNGFLDANGDSDYLFVIFEAADFQAYGMTFPLRIDGAQFFNNDNLSSFDRISLHQVTGDRTSFSFSLSNAIATVDNPSGPALNLGVVNFPTPVTLETETSLALAMKFNEGDMYIEGGSGGGPGIGRDVNGSNNPDFPPAGIERRSRNSYVTVDGQAAYVIASIDDNQPINLVMNLVAHQLAPPDINITTLNYDYGNVMVGNSEDAYINIQNTGGGTLTVQTLASTNPVFSQVSPPTPFTIAPGGNQTTTLRFSPISEGGANTTIIVTSDDPDEGTINITLIGNGTSGPCTPPPLGLVAWYPGEGDANDIQGTNHGTLQDGALTVNGKVGQTFQFDGQNDYVSTPLDIRPQALPEMTWEAWIYPIRINFGGRQAIFSIDDGEHDRGLIIQAGSTEFGVFTGGGIWHVSGAESYQWQHIAVVYTSSDIQFYKNGTLFSRGSPEGYQTSTSTMYFGGNPVFNEYFQGNIDELSVYNRALSANEILAIYNAGSAGKCKPGEEVLDPDINVTQTNLAFGGVAVGANSDLNLQVQNTGDGVLTVTGVTSTNPRFAAINPTIPFTVNSGGTQNITVRFSPNVAGNQTGTLTIASNDPDEPAINVTMTGNGQVPDIALSTTQLNFGNVTVGQTGSANFNISNNGDASLNVATITSDEAQYTLSQAGPLTLQPGASQAVTVTFSPTVQGAVPGTITINSNDPDEATVTVALTGNGVHLFPDINVTPTTVNFGDVNVGQTGTSSVIVQNLGQAALNVTSITSNNTRFSASPTGPFTIPVGGSQTINLSFSPNQQGTVNGTLTVNSNDPDEAQVTVALAGNGVILVPDINVTPATVNFGDVSVGQTGNSSILIENQGQAALNVTSIASNNNRFTATQTGPFTIPVGGSQTVDLSFSPTQTGVQNGTLTVSSNDPDEAQVAITLSGNGVEAAALDPPTGLLAWWPGDGNTDEIVGSKDGTLHNGATYNTGTVDQAFQFDGNDDYMSHSFTLPRQAGTIEHWLLPEYPSRRHMVAYYQSNGTSTDHNGLGDGSDVLEIHTGVHHNTDYVIYYQDGSGWTVAGGGSATSGVWAHVAATWDRAGSLKIYVDGQEVASRDLTSYDFSNHTPTIQRFGQTGNMDPARSWDGRMDEVTVYDRALTQQEIEAIYNAGATGKNKEGVTPQTGDIDVSPLTHNFGDVNLSGASSKNFTISNQGTASLTVTSINDDTPSDAFAVQSSLATPFTMGPGTSQQFTVRFSPTSAGPQSGTITVNSDDIDEPTVQVNLSGNGVAQATDITLPQGYTYTEFATGLEYPVSIAYSSEGVFGNALYFCVQDVQRGAYDVMRYNSNGASSVFAENITEGGEFWWSDDIHPTAMAIDHVGAFGGHMYLTSNVPIGKASRMNDTDDTVVRVQSDGSADRFIMTGPNTYNGKRDLAFGPCGDLYGHLFTSNTAWVGIDRVTPAGNKDSWVSLETGARPTGLVFDDNGKALYAADYGNDRILKIDKEGAVSVFVNNIPDLVDLARDRSGAFGFDLFATSYTSSTPGANEGKIYRIHQDGSFEIFAQDLGFRDADTPELLFGFDGDLFVLEPGRNRIVRIQSPVNPVEVPITPVAAATQPGAQAFWIDVQVGDADHPVSNLFNVQFTLHYSHTDFVDVVTPHSTGVIAGDFMGSNPDFSQTVDEGIGKIDVDISRYTGTSNGYGTALRAQFIIDEELPETSRIRFAVTDVTATNGSGQAISLNPGSICVSRSDAISLTVWPGDLNNDGIVNQTDVLSIGQYWQSSGPARPNASLTWQGQNCPPWNVNQQTYADGNGDGTVDQADLLPVGFNWNKTHATLLAGEYTPLPDAVYLTWNQANQSSVLAVENDVVHLQLHGQQAENLFGISFEIQGNPGVSVQPDDLKIGSWLGDDVIHFSKLNKETGSLSVGITRKKGQRGVFGEGELIRFSFKQKYTGAPSNIMIQNVHAIDTDGRSLAIKLSIRQIVTDVQVEKDMPTTFVLEQNSPNPFNPSTNIAYILPTSTASHSVRLEIFNTRGEKIRTLVDEVQSPGRHQVEWDGNDSAGQSVAGGIYIYRLKAGQLIAVRKMALAK